MVIITTMIAKIYFPESLERGQEPPTINRSYSYRRTPLKRRSDEEGEGLLDSSGGEEEDDEVLCSEDDDEDDDDDLGDENDDDDEEELFLNAPTQRVLEFDQEQTSRTKVVQRLLFCSLMLNITFVTWGALQERMLTRRYPRHTGDYFTYSYALVFTNRFWTLVMSGILLVYLKPRLSRSTVLYEYSFPSISNMLSSWCQYEALRYVSFPATTLFKSFKLAPVMLMGKILGNKTCTCRTTVYLVRSFVCYVWNDGWPIVVGGSVTANALLFLFHFYFLDPVYDYFVALVIGVGIVMFMSSTDELSFSTDYLGNTEVATAKWTGVLLLCLLLFFDSFTSQFQSRMFQRHVDLSMIELMFATSAYSTVLSAITLVHTGELSKALEFVYQHSEIHWHFFMFSICSTIGQLFIFYTIKNFGAVVFTLIMTTRILLSIALSCILYGHEVSGMGFMGLMCVLGAVLYRIKRKAQGTQLIKWQGMEDDKGPELVQEWHEHVDM
jgi:adenosine 3'-phospho 5'-phosphosulfate transporter B2